MIGRLEEARKIFFDNLGSKDLMRENVKLNEYKKYKVTNEIENQWKSELIDDLLDGMKNNTESKVVIIKKLRNVISDVADFGIFKELIRKNDENLKDLDLLEIVFYVEDLIDMLNVFVFPEPKVPLNELLDCIQNLKITLTDVVDNRQRKSNEIYNSMGQYGLGLRESYVENRAIEMMEGIISIERLLE